MKLAFYLNLLVQIMFIALVFAILFFEPIYETHFSPKVLGQSIEQSTPTPINPCRADINKDGAVDELDYAEVKLEFFETDSKADINADSIVDLTDFSLIYANYYSNCAER